MAEAEARAGRRSGDPRRAAGPKPALLPIGGRPPLGVYINQLAKRWPFALAQARAQAMTANRGMVLGNMWLVLNPLLDAAIYFLIFQIVLDVGDRVPNYIAYLLIGVFLFASTRAAIGQGTGIIRANKGLIRAFAFPRAALPLALVVRSFLNSVPVIVVMLSIIMVKPPHALPTATWLLFPVVLALQFMLNLGIAFYLARLTDAYPDLGKAISIGSRLLLYASCVIFPDERIRSLPGGDIVLDVNPIYHVLDISRDLLIYDTLPEARSWLILTAYAVGGLVFGFIYFWRGEVSYGRTTQ
ncbi:ABC transporter permease [Naumannella halotolerans]|uniref:Teichoic acid transport system permease protein n=1 Tax=Naumannella halotolerans TaxID=993414 RepID=A0A4R7IYU0_9ACTN|nr:ABC transporter permease [Naumannella halotolerans]TDT29951.1 teichoic acid transport system permease protein [Naumannella halotolerans]